MSRSYLRGNLARALYNRILDEESLGTFDKSKWYSCDISYLPDYVGEKFMQLDLDRGTEEFLENSLKKSDLLFLQLFHVLARAFLSIFLTQTSINGVLGRGAMFVFSWMQFEKLTGLAPLALGERSLLDLGAGDGAVTDVMRPYFSRIDVTEVSWPMQRVLRTKGFSVVDVNSWAEADRKYDFISVLNLLDRCEKPLTLLNDVKGSLKPKGGVIIALVWPFRPYVESGGIKNKPLENISLNNTSVEEQAKDLTRILEYLDFEVVKWSKVPYLCEGDFFQSYYWLTDILIYARLKF